MKYAKYMVFVDGSNFLVQLSKKFEMGFRADRPPLTAIDFAHSLINKIFQHRQMHQVRRYWFASYQGADDTRIEYAEYLRRFKFEPVLFQKKKGREKGVDIALTKELLVNSFNQNLDYALLVAGDEDYVGLVSEAKRYGPIIEGAFFEDGLSGARKLACDNFFIFQEEISGDWDKFLVRIRGSAT